MEKTTVRIYVDVPEATRDKLLEVAKKRGALSLAEAVRDAIHDFIRDESRVVARV